MLESICGISVKEWGLMRFTSTPVSLQTVQALFLKSLVFSVNHLGKLFSTLPDCSADQSCVLFPLLLKIRQLLSITDFV